MPDIKETFAQNLRVLRKSKQLSQMELAERCDLSTKFIQEMEAGRRYPGPKSFEAIADALGVEPYQLIMDPTAEGTGLGEGHTALWALDRLEDHLVRLVRNEIQDLRDSLHAE